MVIVKHSYLSWRSKKYADIKSVQQRKLTVVRTAVAHLKYVQHRDGSDRQKPGRKFFDLTNDEIAGQKVRNAVKRAMWDGQALHKFTFSPDVNVDKLKECAREIVREIERKKGLDLEGCAFGVIHTNTAHHHVHMQFLSKDKNGVSYRFSKEDYAYMKEAGDRYLDRHFPVEREAASIGRWVQRNVELPEHFFFEKQKGISQRRWHSFIAQEPEFRAAALKALGDFERKVKERPEEHRIEFDRRKLSYDSPLKLLRDVRRKHLVRYHAQEDDDGQTVQESPLSYKDYSKLRLWIAVKEGKEVLKQIDEAAARQESLSLEAGNPVYASLQAIHGVVKFVLAQIPVDWTKKDEMRDNLSALRDLKARMYTRYHTARNNRDYEAQQKLGFDLKNLDSALQDLQDRKSERDTDEDRRKSRRPDYDFTREDFD